MSLKMITRTDPVILLDGQVSNLVSSGENQVEGQAVAPP